MRGRWSPILPVGRQLKPRATPLLNRLPAEGEHRLKGAEIDRGRPLSFRLDGREIHGFAGDTLLSAAIASGLTGAGRHQGEPLALDERFSPAVLHRGGMHDRLNALPMAITPAVGGLDLVTLEQAGRPAYQQRLELLRGMLPAGRRRLGIAYDEDGALPSPWFDAVASEAIDADLAVIGGGLAGLSAALVAARRGERVVLVERRQWLGGDARFFGSTGDEAPPDEVVAGLLTALRSLPNATILTRTEAFALFEGTVRLTRVDIDAGIPVSRALKLNAPRIVLAVGSLERLPIFPGNRLPGVVGSVAAFHRADRFGVWIGRRALLSTATSVGYRAVMQARDAGVDVLRVADTRLNPQSRFIEFGKASGIPQARDLRAASAAPAGRRGGLLVRLEHDAEVGTRQHEEFTVEQFLVAGGWQPDLTLWHMAGGSSRWNAGEQRLEAEGRLHGIAMAGSVAGWRNGAACVASGQAAVARLYSRSVPEIRDPQIDAIYETPDHPCPVAAFDPSVDANAYLDGGTSLALRPAPPRRRRRGLWELKPRAPWGMADEARPLGVADVAAGVQVGEIPPDDAPIVAQERCITPGDIVDAGSKFPLHTPTSAAATEPPAYLAGRFGTRTTTWLVEAADGRAFEVGCLVHLNVDSTNPGEAIGVVFAPAPGGRTGGLAVIGKFPLADGEMLAVKDISAAIPVRLVDPLKPTEERPRLVPPPAAPARLPMAAILGLDGATAKQPIAGDGGPVPEAPAVPTEPERATETAATAPAEALSVMPAAGLAGNGAEVGGNEDAATGSAPEPVIAREASPPDAPAMLPAPEPEPAPEAPSLPEEAAATVPEAEAPVPMPVVAKAIDAAGPAVDGAPADGPPPLDAPLVRLDASDPQTVPSPEPESGNSDGKLAAE